MYQEEQPLFKKPEGRYQDFLESLQNWELIQTDNPEILKGSTSWEELQERRRELEYREIWLQTILDEVRWEIQLIDSIGDSLENLPQ